MLLFLLNTCTFFGAHNKQNKQYQTINKKYGPHKLQIHAAIFARHLTLLGAHNKQDKQQEGKEGKELKKNNKTTKEILAADPCCHFLQTHAAILCRPTLPFFADPRCHSLQTHAAILLQTHAAIFHIHCSSFLIFTAHVPFPLDVYAAYFLIYALVHMPSTYDPLSSTSTLFVPFALSLGQAFS